MSRNAIWQSKTNTNNCKNPRLVNQRDGNVVIYSDNKAIWSTKTNKPGNQCYELVMQNDGNLVLYDKNKSIWSSKSNAWLIPQSEIVFFLTHLIYFSYQFFKRGRESLNKNQNLRKDKIKNQIEPQNFSVCYLNLCISSTPVMLTSLPFILKTNIEGSTLILK